MRKQKIVFFLFVKKDFIGGGFFYSSVIVHDSFASFACNLGTFCVSWPFPCFRSAPNLASSLDYFFGFFFSRSFATAAAISCSSSSTFSYRSLLFLNQPPEMSPTSLTIYPSIFPPKTKKKRIKFTTLSSYRCCCFNLTPTVTKWSIVINLIWWLCKTITGFNDKSHAIEPSIEHGI